MSDRLNHECGLALIRLLKPLEFYQEKYGSASYGLNKLYLMLEKQHNRGQDGAGFASVKFNMKPGQRFMHRERSADQNPIQEIFKLANENLSAFVKEHPKSKDDITVLKNLTTLDDCELIKKIGNWEIELTSNNNSVEENNHPDWYGYKRIDEI